MEYCRGENLSLNIYKVKYLSRLQQCFFSVFTAIFFSIFFGLSSQSASAVNISLSNYLSSIPTLKITPASNATSTNNPKSQNKTEVLGANTNRSSFAFIFVIIGSLFFLVCGILAFHKYEEGKDKKSSG